MRRTGRAACLLAVLFGAWPALAADIEFYQQVEHTTVGVQDPFRLTVVVTNAPDGAAVDFPASGDFETLARADSTQTSLEIVNGAANVKRSRTFTLTLRALKAGTLHIPASQLRVEGRTYKTEPITLTVRKEHVATRPPPRAQDPFGAMGFPSPGGGREVDVDDEPLDEPGVDVPRGDSDLFLRSSLDRTEAYAGEQLTLSLSIYSRVDLSTVDSVTMPKLDGFWSEDVDSPTQLTPEQKVVNGIPYRVYLVKRRAIFPVKPGTLSLEAAEADITTGFLFAGRRVHRVGNVLTLKVKPLPGNPPAGFSPANVGSWQLSVEAATRKVTLGNPVTVDVTVEGRGNVRNVVIPKLVVPPGLKPYDPTASEHVSTTRNQVMGKRTQEYLVMPQQTGTFTLPGLAFAYFNPETKRYEVSRTQPITFVVSAAAGGAGRTVAGTPTSADAGTPKNVLSAGGLRPLRYAAHFEPLRERAWTAPLLYPALIGPPFAWAALGLVGLVRGRRSRDDPASAARKKAKAARARLAQAETLRTRGDTAGFYSEVERALLAFLEAKLGVPLAGLTREALQARLAAKGIAPDVQGQVARVLDACDLGRFAPGAVAGTQDSVLSDAAHVFEVWPS